MHPNWWLVVQVELVVDEMRRSLARRAGVDRRLPQFVGLSGFQDFAINIVVLVSPTTGLCATTSSHAMYHHHVPKEIGSSLGCRPFMMCHDHILLKI